MTPFLSELRELLDKHYPKERELTVQEVKQILDAYAVGLGIALMRYAEQGAEIGLGRYAKEFYDKIGVLFEVVGIRHENYPRKRP